MLTSFECDARVTESRHHLELIHIQHMTADEQTLSNAARLNVVSLQLLCVTTHTLLAVAAMTVCAQKGTALDLV